MIKKYPSFVKEVICDSNIFEVKFNGENIKTRSKLEIKTDNQSGEEIVYFLKFPSHANESVSDTVVNRMINFFYKQNVSKIIFLNVTPFYLEDGRGLPVLDKIINSNNPSKYNEIINYNLKIIERVLSEKKRKVYKAWGKPIGDSFNLNKIEILIDKYSIGNFVFEHSLKYPPQAHKISINPL
ncbi:DUF1643 domain-containing protein [Bacillus pumilus]|uniref:DUF1643 domain-containing protein n=1 Tax=Bacillus pumilus TaxID=1408 RepID=UPI003000EA34